ncbi:hypothetical protein [Terricaulis sp.]|uniref:hypothetical protein n=1 Tax=Terricaulis sp. TaxID=2768686 RepID=UPI003782E1B0
MSSGAHSWSVKGIDPKVREAAREAAARQGMSLGEYLSQALASAQGGGSPSLVGDATGQTPRTPAYARTRTGRYGATPHYDLTEDDEDWRVSGPTTLAPRITDPSRLVQRIEQIERRTQLAVSGLDRAVSTLDRSVLGLAARIDEAESIADESADRIADALEQFKLAGDTFAGRLESAEGEVASARVDLAQTKARLGEQVSTASAELAEAKERLENQVAVAEEVARRAEAAASFLATEIENRDAAIGHKLGALEDQTREGVTHALNLARAAAEEAARQAAEASADAVAELRRLQERMAERLTETENSARRAVETAIEETRAELGERTARAETEARGAREALLEEVVRLETQISNRIAAADQIKSEQQQLISRIEKAEAGARESTAGLRQAAGAAIADLRNAQLGLAARLKQVEETAGRNGALDLADVRQQQQDISERLAGLEENTRANPVGEALSEFEKKLEAIAARVERPEFDRRLEELSAKIDASAGAKLDEVGGAVKTLDDAMQRLSARLAETENTANTAIRTLEETVAALGAKVENAGVAQDTEALRAMLETRLDTMAQQVTDMVGQAQSELTGHVHAALEGMADAGLDGALADVNRRLAAAERRQAQTIEAISIEIKRMSESVDQRLRSVEARNDDAAASAVREELTRMATTLERRFDEIERREAAAFDRMGLEVGRLSERLEERVGAVEGRSAQAIEQVGEQVARMAERFNQRHEILAREMGERMLDSEERAGARVSEAISSIMQRLNEVEEHSAEAIAPVQKAVSSVAERLNEFETGAHPDEIPTPTRRFEDFSAFGDPPLAAASPLEAAQPTRAAPLPPASLLSPPMPAPAPAPEPPAIAEVPNDHDIYFAEEIDLIAEEAPVALAEETDAFAAPESEPEPVVDFGTKDFEAVDDLMIEDPILDDADAFATVAEEEDPFWSPDATAVSTPDTPLAGAPAEELFELTDETPAEPAPPPGKNDYLKNARAAAQAAAQPKDKKEKKAKKTKAAATADGVAPTPTYSLRGPTRIVLWGAAVAVAIAGGAWYMKRQSAHDAQPEPSSPEPDVTTPTQALPPPAATYDPSTASQEGGVQDPFGLPADATTPPGATPQHGAATPPPVAQAPAGVRQASVAAGPLPARNVSLEQAAQSGDLVAQYELALQRISAARTEEGVTLLRRAADRGLAMAQYRLAKLYERGEGVTADLVVARQWTERAAAAGNRRAMHDLGVYFARGEGAPLDEAAAFRWFRQAAELGVADSQYNLGVLYQQGRGVGASASEAMFWFLVAARQGDEDAAARAQALGQTLQPIQVEQARARAQAFRPRASSAQANGEFGPRPWSTPARTPGT